MNKKDLRKIIKEEVHNVILEQNYVDWFDYDWGEGFHMGGMNKIYYDKKLKQISYSIGNTKGLFTPKMIELLIELLEKYGK